MADFQAMLQKFLQYAQQAPQDGQLNYPPPLQNRMAAAAPALAAQAQAMPPQNQVPMPQARPSMPGMGAPQAIPLPQPRPPMAGPPTGGLAGTGGMPQQPMNLAPPMQPQQAAPNLFQRSAMMQTDPNTGQPINPQAAALAQALMQQRAPG